MDFLPQVHFVRYFQELAGEIGVYLLEMSTMVVHASPVSTIVPVMVRQ